MVSTLIQMFAGMAVAMFCMYLGRSDWPWYVVAPTILATLIAFFGGLMYFSLPRRPYLIPTGEDQVDDDLLDLLEDYHELGFELVGPPYRVPSSSPTVLVALVHRDGRAYGSITRLSPATQRRIIMHELSSNLQGDGELNTISRRDGAIFPKRLGKFAQIFPDGPPVLLYEQHCRGLRWLEAQGVRVQRADRELFAESFRADMEGFRQYFRRRWLLCIPVVLWRMATKHNPKIGPLAQQAKARAAAEQFVRQCNHGG